MTTLTLCAPCMFGLESVLSGEIKRIGGENIETTDGRVLFTGDAALLARANLWLRTAERVCLVIGSFEARSFTELFDAVLELPMEDYIGKTDAFPVKGWSVKSGLFSISDCQSIIKKAVCKRLEKAYGLTWFEETGPVHQLMFSIHKDVVTMMLDSTGVGLHKRGYRPTATGAPIKETLAAGICDLARTRWDDTVVDPMCGSGTFLIESALRAFNIAPGVRRQFAGEKWGLFPAALWREERDKAVAAIKRDSKFRGIGTDIDALAVGITQENAARAGVGGKIITSMADLRSFVPPEGNATIFCNPPYGERLLDLDEAEELYRVMGRVFRFRPGLRYFIINPHENFEQLFGRRADKRRKLYNGMIKCQLYMYL